MGLFDRLRNFGSRIFEKVKTGIQHVIPIVKRIAPIVQTIGSMIPHPAAQKIASGAGIVGNVLDKVS